MNNAEYYNKKIDYYNLYKQNNYGNPLILKEIKQGSVVFDIGCNTGNLARGLSELKKCKVYGVDISNKAIKTASKFLIESKVLDLENFSKLPFDKTAFDYVVLADVLEHIKNPSEVLNKIREQLNFKYLIVSLPNIAFIKIRLNLLLGRFNYESHGIMDESHVHFYTKDTMQDLFIKSGYKVVSYKPFPLTNKKLSFITHPITKLFPTLFGRQFVWVLVSS